MFISEVVWFPHFPACIWVSRSDISCITLLTQSLFLYTSGPQSSMFPHTFSIRESENAICTCNSCAHRPNSRAGRNCGLQRRSRLFAHIHRFKMVNTLTASQIPEPLSVISRLHPKKLVKAMELHGSSCRATFNFTSEWSVLGMRTMFSSASVTAFELFVSFPRSVCNPEFLQTILDLVLQLVDLVLVLELLCL